MPGDEELPLPERPNPRSADLDLGTPEEIVATLARCDRQLFEGEGGGPGGVLAAEVVAAATRAARLVREHLPGRVVLAGAGTSGRLAWILARRHGPACRARGGEVVPLIAGGDLALVRSEEGAEDEVEGAREEAARALGPPGVSAVYVGISCGLSAPCVGGGLAAAWARPGTGVVVLGTNRVELARPVALGGGRTFRELLAEAGAGRRGCLLLPDVGPEAVTGSTRLKGGSAAWSLLDAVLRRALDGTADGDLTDRIRVDLERKALIQEEVYRHCEYLAALVAGGGRALRLGGSILYLGRGEPGLAGVLDASECPPTFGAHPQDVRAFTAEGWAGLAGPGERAGALERAWPLTLEWCRSHLLPLLGPESLPLLTGPDPELARSVREQGLVPLTWAGDGGLLAAKLALNVVSTGAHVLAGKVYGNRMVDLSLSNSKLFERACRIVADLAGVGPERARRAVVASARGVDDPSPELLAAPAAAHVAAARGREKVVPVALIVAATGATLARARQAILAEPVVRQALRRLLPGKG